MLRSMFSAVSGLRNHQTYMDVIGNNISNVNTTAFKAGRITFQEMLSQLVRSGSAPEPQGRGGINPAQVGLGSMVGAIDTLHTQGAFQTTGQPTDLAIQGDGFFIVTDGTRRFYTRDGAFNIGPDGSVVSSATGLKVMGWVADQNGQVDPAGPLGVLSLPLGAGMVARATAEARIDGNLKAGVTDPVTLNLTVYDSLGHPHGLTVTFTRTGPDTWGWAVSTAEAGVAATGSGTLTFDADGRVAAGGTGTIQVTYTPATLGYAPQTPQDIALDFTSLTQTAGNTNLTAETDGSSPGSFATFSITGNGEIYGIYSNGQRRLLGQVALARFVNPGGLMHAGSNLYDLSPNSGDPQVGAAGAGGRGEVISGVLEMSNVDLAREFTNLIMAERGFQANARVLTASDQLLQELANIKR